MKDLNSIKIILPIVFSVMMNNYSYSQKIYEYIVTGKIRGLPNGVKLSLITANNQNSDIADTLQIVRTKGEGFQFKIQNPIKGKMCFLIVDTNTFKFSNKRVNWIRLILDTSSINIDGNSDIWPLGVVTSSLATLIYEQYHRLNDSCKLEIAALTSEIPKDSLRIKNAKENHKKVLNDYFKMNGNSYAVPLLIMNSYTLTTAEKIKAYDSLSDKIKMSFYGQQLKTANQINFGEQIPDFSIVTANNNSISLKGLTTKNKITLIDFWASWCVPCRSAIPHLKSVYKKFKDFGFNIIGISTDKDEIRWKKALSDENMPWDNGLDVANFSKSFFSVEGIPAYILLDATGKIIASDVISLSGKGIGVKGYKIRGEELEKTLETLLIGNNKSN
ncbi:TlpA disulfide reductase family protein [Pedobacter heparinus]|uniref:TlpA family protein disulfide reductase n=1 Tax=Pedobacter heparinus TaxID=984 RepID=UPI002931BA03|nr:TlpA disulfide reductase family protein [Pedobacter heparinus]